MTVSYAYETADNGKKVARAIIEICPIELSDLIAGIARDLISDALECSDVRAEDFDDYTTVGDVIQNFDHIVDFNVANQIRLFVTDKSLIDLEHASLTELRAVEETTSAIYRMVCNTVLGGEK